MACHNPSYVTHYDMVDSLKDGGTFLLNCPWTAEELDDPAARFHEEGAGREARQASTPSTPSRSPAQVGLGNRINTIMQAAFFKLADVIPYEDADKYMKAAIKKSYGKKGDDIVKKNCDAIDIAIAGLK